MIRLYALAEKTLEDNFIKHDIFLLPRVSVQVRVRADISTNERVSLLETFTLCLRTSPTFLLGSIKQGQGCSYVKAPVSKDTLWIMRCEQQ